MSKGRMLLKLESGCAVSEHRERKMVALDAYHWNSMC